MKSALIAIAKNEDNYIDEWIEYNIKLGFDEIFISQNNWRANLRKTYGNVHLLECDGEKMQMKCYNDFILYNQHISKDRRYDFAAFFDIDEFLVLKRPDSKTINDELGHYLDVPAISVPWRVFGDNGQRKVENGNYSVIDRFTRCHKNIGGLKKNIVNLNVLPKNALFEDPHRLNGVPMIDPARTVTTQTSLLPDSINAVDEPMELFHYHTKTLEEFIYRKLSGDVFYGKEVTEKRTVDTETEFYNKVQEERNQEENLLAYNFFHDIKT